MPSRRGARLKSSVTDLFHDRRDEGRRHTPSESAAQEWSRRTGNPSWHRDSPMWSAESRRAFAEDDMRDREADEQYDREGDRDEWADKMMRAQDAEEDR